MALSDSSVFEVTYIYSFILHAVYLIVLVRSMRDDPSGDEKAVFMPIGYYCDKTQTQTQRHAWKNEDLKCNASSVSPFPRKSEPRTSQASHQLADSLRDLLYTPIHRLYHDVQEEENRRLVFSTAVCPWLDSEILARVHSYQRSMALWPQKPTSFSSYHASSTTGTSQTDGTNGPLSSKTDEAVRRGDGKNQISLFQRMMLPLQGAIR